MKIKDLIPTLIGDMRIQVYESMDKLFDKYLFETIIGSGISEYFSDREIEALTPSSTETNVLKIVLKKEETNV